MNHPRAGALRLEAGEREVVVCAMARSPFGRFGGALAEWDAARLGAAVIDAMLARAGIQAAAVQALYNGVGLAGAATLSVTRQMVLRASLSPHTPSVGLDRACCSGIAAIAQAARDIAAGLQDVAVAGGVEVLSNMPLFLPRRRGIRPGSVQLDDPLVLGGAVVDRPIATYSGEEALRFGVDRAQQDAWACDSHRRYFAAQAAGCFDMERIALRTDPEDEAAPLLESDEGPRRDSTPERLARLKTVYGSPTITAGNAPGLSDGAAFLVLATRAEARAQGWPVLGRIAACAQVAGGPTSGTSTPAVALQRLLAAAGVAITEVERIEINEAYAATPLVSTQVLADGDAGLQHALRERTNPWGGAVAIGHPLGASGARLAMTLLAGFAHDPRPGVRYGAAAICGGFGQGDALLVASADE